MNILGINVGSTADPTAAHDGGAALIVEGKLSGAIAEERLTRRKHCGGYEHASRMLLGQAGLTERDLDLVVVSNYGNVPDLGLYGNLGFGDATRVEMIPSHHLAHAYSSFFPSNFDEALILVADNEGCILGERRHEEMWKNAMERLTLYRGEGTDIHLLERDMDQEDVVGLGELYGNVTRYVGLGSYLNAGKTMALASFGDPSVYAEVPMIELLPDGRISCPMRNDYLNASEEIRRFFAAHGHELPPQRDPCSSAMDPIWASVAAALQHQIEEALLHKVRYWVRKTGIRRLCLAGGVALNCVANRRLLDEVPLQDIFVQPNSGDQGLGLGNALYGWHALSEKDESIFTDSSGVYLGGHYSDDQIIAALVSDGDGLDIRHSEDPCGDAACAITDGEVIGWFQGRSEWGPRALGNRSILADPRNIATKDHVNSKVKHRESFRPFAPVVLEHEAARFFAIDRPCPHMTVVTNVRPEMRARLPAVTHVDGSARVQTVCRDQNAKLFDLLTRYNEKTGLPVLLNTSFNDNNEPLVESPEDAVSCFRRTGLDKLFINNVVVARNGG